MLFEGNFILQMFFYKEIYFQENVEGRRKAIGEDIFYFHYDLNYDVQKENAYFTYRVKKFIRKTTAGRNLLT